MKTAHELFVIAALIFVAGLLGTDPAVACKADRCTNPDYQWCHALACSQRSGCFSDCYQLWCDPQINHCHPEYFNCYGQCQNAYERDEEACWAAFCFVDDPFWSTRETPLSGVKGPRFSLEQSHRIIADLVLRTEMRRLTTRLGMRNETGSIKLDALLSCQVPNEE